MKLLKLYIKFLKILKEKREGEVKMKRMLIGMGIIAGMVNTVIGSELKEYFDRIYPQVRQCVMQEMKSEDIYKPAIKIENKRDVIDYLKALDLPKGYYVVVDTTKFTASSICFLQLVFKEMGNNPQYYKPVEKIVVNIFSRKQDAIYLKDKLENSFNLKGKVDIFEIF